LTVVSSALLFVLEFGELVKHPTGLKVGGLLLNVVIVVSLVIRLVWRRCGTGRERPRWCPVARSGQG
jgi:uncharacterized membrane protein (DUF2068 family)